MSARFVLDKYQVKTLYDMYKKGTLNIQPEYQRSRVWTDPQRYGLIDTTMHEWPMGLLMFNVTQQVDEDNTPVDHYDIVDGQQRIRTLFEYIDGHQWGKMPTKREVFTPYKQLSASGHDRFDQYRVSIALMYDYEESDILDVYSRLQRGKPLRIGEKVKALNTDFKPYIKKLSEHKIFKVASGRHRVRDGHWNLASLFFKSVYRKKPLDRHEYAFLEDFLKSGPIDELRARQASEQTNKILNFQDRVIQEALQLDRKFDDAVSSPRFMKWLFAALYLLMERYSLAGKEHLVATGVRKYFQKKDLEGTDEWVAYTNTGRSGRIDTDDVRACLEQLMNRIVIAADAEPLDPQRFFSPSQRNEIFLRSKRTCAHCESDLSRTNFHADHVRPYIHGGPTTVENGQALCTACNRRKSGNPDLFTSTDKRKRASTPSSAR